MNLEQAFNKAINSCKNFQRGGAINWHFVDAECVKAMGHTALTGLECDDFYDEFNKIAAKYEKHYYPEASEHNNWIDLKGVLWFKQDRLLSSCLKVIRPSTKYQRANI